LYKEAKAAILNEEVVMPEYFSAEAKDLITRLLDKNFKTRLGCTEFECKDSIKKHPFFANIDWDKLAKCEIPAPYTPKLKSVDDLNYIDPMFKNAVISKAKEQPTAVEKKANKMHINWDFAYVHPRYKLGIADAIEEQKQQQQESK